MVGMEAVYKLATAIITLALRDATTNRENAEEARSWLLDDEDGFQFWCTMAEIDPERLRVFVQAELKQANKGLGKPWRRSRLHCW